VRLESLGFGDVYDYAGGKADWLANGFPTERPPDGVARIGAILRSDIVTCDLLEQVDEVASRLRNHDQATGVVVHGENVVMGRVRLEALNSNDEGPVEAVMEPGPSTYRPDVPITEMLSIMREHAMEIALVTTNDGILIGAFHRADAEALLGDGREIEAVAAR
jgi:CBS domain-containing protein